MPDGGLAKSSGFDLLTSEVPTDLLHAVRCTIPTGRGSKISEDLSLSCWLPVEAIPEGGVIMPDGGALESDGVASLPDGAS